ncbi:hypothetical protein HPB51_008450 [Rhipicephalus microplus]|uniref:Uncharacterized protein n=1 Tax=Rhipicephalus microplus TaxID=6941 RepID=A0A9J6EZZ8_RHIMP|nr:hypothetical protein HPB51_008450 [Rhipicephalus microplus]
MNCPKRREVNKKIEQKRESAAKRQCKKENTQKHQLCSSATQAFPRTMLKPRCKGFYKHHQFHSQSAGGTTFVDVVRRANVPLTGSSNSIPHSSSSTLASCALQPASSGGAKRPLGGVAPLTELPLTLRQALPHNNLGTLTITQQPQCSWPLRTFLTPFLLNHFHISNTTTPLTVFSCTCNCRAYLNHLCWDCSAYNPPRLRALATINRGPWPFFSSDKSLPGAFAPDRAIKLWRALILFLQDPTAPLVGDLLLDSYKIQAIQMAPTYCLYDVRQ